MLAIVALEYEFKPRIPRYVTTAASPRTVLRKCRSYRQLMDPLDTPPAAVYVYTGRIPLVGGRRLVAPVRPRGFGARAAERHGQRSDDGGIPRERLRVDQDRGGARPGHPGAVGLPGLCPGVAGRGAESGGAVGVSAFLARARSYSRFSAAAGGWVGGWLGGLPVLGGYLLSTWVDLKCSGVGGVVDVVLPGVGRHL